MTLAHTEMPLQLVGAKVSTFTRTIRMALEYLHIPYELTFAPPHSDIAYKYNPFGKIPTLVHDDYIVNETVAMRLYIDHLSASTTATAATADIHSLTPADFQSILKVGKWISIASDYAFRGLILPISKPRLSMEAEGKSEQEIQEKLKHELESARSILRGIESHFKADNGGFVVGNTLTWADLFLYPIFADFCSLPEAELVQGEAPLLYEWYEKMGQLSIAKATFAGTVAEARL
ncbi:hypothetical protein GGI12_002122 [Dipsacomyces acuminosporus]|nr:hypothetical protein GGI12_002122 [Dipsacomyces acuminosporus]